jgi:hypothetical protein
MPIVILAATASIVLCGSAGADQFVNGYTRQNGTYVAPHYQSSPNSSYNDNWSTRGNTNPYTGMEGTKAPTYNDRAPSYGSGSGSLYGSPSGGHGRRGGW